MQITSYLKKKKHKEEHARRPSKNNIDLLQELCDYRFGKLSWYRSLLDYLKILPWVTLVVALLFLLEIHDNVTSMTEGLNWIGSTSRAPCSSFLIFEGWAVSVEITFSQLLNSFPRWGKYILFIWLGWWLTFTGYRYFTFRGKS